MWECGRTADTGVEDAFLVGCGALGETFSFLWFPEIETDNGGLLSAEVGGRFEGRFRQGESEQSSFLVERLDGFTVFDC